MIDDKEWLANEVKSKSLRMIADEIGVPYSRVQSKVKKLGITVPKRTKYHYTEESRRAKSEHIKYSLELRYPSGRFGKESANWRGGISPVEKNIRSLTIYKEWRQEVLEREGYMCAECGRTEDLEVDHYPITFVQLIRNFNIKESKEALQYYEFWDLENGRVLCHEHHVELTQFGRPQDSATDIEKHETMDERDIQINALFSRKNYLEKRNSDLAIRYKNRDARVAELEKFIKDNGLELP